MLDSLIPEPTNWLWLVLELGAFALPLYLVIPASYALYFHPLSKIPGPKLWAVSRVPYVRSLWAGTLVFDIERFHAQYGVAVRIAPDEVSFASPKASTEIYGARQGNPMNKARVWYDAPSDHGKAIINALDHQDHGRMRRAMRPGFTEKAILQQEPILQHYVDLLVQKLEEKSSSATSQHQDAWTEIDIVEWATFATLDIIGDLGFGESFDCLETGEYHRYVSIVASFFQAIIFIVSLRYWPLAERLLTLFIPKSLEEKRIEMMDICKEKIGKRLNLEKSRPDFIGHINWSDNWKEGEEGLSFPEVLAMSHQLIYAGSETVASLVSGIFDFLVRDPEGILQRVTQEVRESFDSRSDMTFAAIKGLPYLEAVIQEGLRLCNPTVLGLPREVPEGGAMICDYWVPKGITVHADLQTLAHSSSQFHRPMEFIPERWLNSSITNPKSSFHNDNRNAVPTFGTGARSCIGKGLAMQEVRLILAHLLWSFDFADTSTPQEKWENRKSYMMVDKGDRRINIKPATERRVSIGL